MLYQITDGSVSLGGQLILSHIDFEKCYINACKSRFILVCKDFKNGNTDVDGLCKKYHLSKATIQRY